MFAIFEPIGAGIIVSLINKYFIGNKDLFKSCTAQYESEDEDDSTQSAVTAINSDVSSIPTHIHF